MRKKRCGTCGVEKDASEFYRHIRGRDGLQHQCKACHADYYRGRGGKGGTCAVPLRPGLTVFIRNLPADLSRREAERISRVLMALAFIPGEESP